MSKFKIGDIIIGNKKADRYVYTNCGTKCKVIPHDPSFLSFIGDTKVEIMEGRQKGEQYTVRSECFDLYTPHQGKVLIMVDEKDPNKVVAHDLITGKKAEAKCNPKDEWDFEKGAKLAFSRLYPDHEENEEKKPWTGKVICIKSYSGSKYFTEGRIYSVEKGRLYDNMNCLPWVGITSIDELNRIVNYPYDCGIKFIEYKGGLE